MQESRDITRRSASNLALAFVLLPRVQRDAMSVLYAFCREVDDVADEDSVPREKRRQTLAAWREDVRRACSGGEPQFAVNRELQSVLRARKLPFELFDELIRGCEMDLEIQRYDTYEQLEQYCYRVASVVGLLSIEIFGYRNSRCRDYAVSLGKALQLTNILRDVHTDAARGRIYLPRCELIAHGVREEEILRGEYSPKFRAAAAAVAQHARRFYQLAREQLPPEDCRAMIAAELMGSVYWRLLRKLETAQFNVFGPEPTRVSKPQKLLLIFRVWLRLASGAVTPNYGAP